MSTSAVQIGGNARLTEPSTRGAAIDLNSLWTVLNGFVEWVETTGFRSYDQYDFWSTRYGRFAKKMYYSHHIAGVPFIAPIVLLDWLVPSSRSLFVSPSRFAIADAHFIQGFLQLYHATGMGIYLAKAVEIANAMMKQSIQGYHGCCWGYPFHWETTAGVIERSTPLITTTPYCFEAFLSLYDTTQDRRYLETASSIARFAAEDIPDTVTSTSASACGYYPSDKSRVVNASAYRAFLLAEAYHRFHDDRYHELAQRNASFVLQMQRRDGSWPYADGNGYNSFVDNFHTCFVLKNLVKANHVFESPSIDNAIKIGYQYYKNYLFRSGLPKPFASISRLQLAKVETYDIAEGISLGLLLRDMIPGAFETALHLALLACGPFREKRGYFTTRIMVGGVRNSVPYLRWPQSQMFYGLASLYRSLCKGE